MERVSLDFAGGADSGLAGKLRDTRRSPDRFVPSVRSLAAMAIRVGLRIYEKLNIVGRENLPFDRSFILVANHASHLDALCLLSALPVRQLNRTFPIAASEYFRVNRWLFFLAKLIVNLLPFDRQFAYWYSLSLCA